MPTAALRDQVVYTSTAWRPLPTIPASRRIASLDIVRGVVMVLMAIDHVRVYSGLPPGGPSPGIFFTRWITHFVAPSFLFLAGTSAYLYGQRVGDKRKLATFLLTRGLWLVLLELTVLRFAWTFNFDYAHYSLAGVIWMIGWCMMLMSGLVFLPLEAVGAIGVAIMTLHNVTDYFPAAMTALRQGSLAWLWKILYFGGEIHLGANGPPLIVLFVILRAIDGYGDPGPWTKAPVVQAAAGAGQDRLFLRGVRARAVLLLCAAHPAHSFARVRCLADSRRVSDSVALHQPSDG
jgi:predicted acyltransferase